MSISVGDGESYPDPSFSVPQLLYATKKKLQDSLFSGRYDWNHAHQQPRSAEREPQILQDHDDHEPSRGTVTSSPRKPRQTDTLAVLLQVDSLERDALEILALVRSMKNTFVHIGRIPPDILLLIPGYWETCDTDKNTITLTHVCRSWRESFIACSSLWTQLDCANIDKTHTYIERSRSSCLELSLRRCEDATYLEDAFLLVAPHISRLKSLSIVGTEDLLQNLTQHISRSAPLLGNLTIQLNCDPGPTLNIELFNGDLSSLHTLSLAGVGTHLPWKNLSNLTTFKLFQVPEGHVSIAQLLNFFESAYRLRSVTLSHSIATLSDAPPERVMSLRHLKNLTIIADPPVHSILLDHLIIQTQVWLTLKFKVNGNGPPVRDFLPKELGNLKNINSVTLVNLYFGGSWRSVLLGVDSGRLHIDGRWGGLGDAASFDLDRQVFQSLNHFTLSGVQQLVVTKFKPPTVGGVENSAPYLVLLHMNALHTLTLVQCNNLPFILALDPDQNPSKHILCLGLEEINLYIEDLESFNIPELMAMVKARASRGTKLSSITIVGLGELLPGREVFKLKEYVTRVDYRFEESPPKWYSTSAGGGS